MVSSGYYQPPATVRTGGVYQDEGAFGSGFSSDPGCAEEVSLLAGRQAAGFKPGVSGPSLTGQRNNYQPCCCKQKESCRGRAPAGVNG